MKTPAEWRRELTEKRCATMGGPDAHLGTSRVDCGACIEDVFAEVLREARAAALEQAAQHIAGKAEWYPVDVFPEASTSSDAIAAGMGRHCAKVWAESLRELAAEAVDP